eukprot:617060-Pyramimonas_sp.AAC.1
MPLSPCQIRLDILARARPGRDLGSSGLGAFWFPHLRPLGGPPFLAPTPRGRRLSGGAACRTEMLTRTPPRR